MAELSSPELNAVFSYFGSKGKTKGTGKGKGRRGNPIGTDGKVMTCSICKSEQHFRAQCPQNTQTEGRQAASYAAYKDAPSLTNSGPLQKLFNFMAIVNECTDEESSFVPMIDPWTVLDPWKHASQQPKVEHRPKAPSHGSGIHLELEQQPKAPPYGLQIQHMDQVSPQAPSPGGKPSPGVVEQRMNLSRLLMFHDDDTNADIAEPRAAYMSSTMNDDTFRAAAPQPATRARMPHSETTFTRKDDGGWSEVHDAISSAAASSNRSAEQPQVSQSKPVHLTPAEKSALAANINARNPHLADIDVAVSKFTTKKRLVETILHDIDAKPAENWNGDDDIRTRQSVAYTLPTDNIHANDNVFELINNIAAVDSNDTTANRRSQRLQARRRALRQLEQVDPETATRLAAQIGERVAGQPHPEAQPPPAPTQRAEVSTCRICQTEMKYGGLFTCGHYLATLACGHTLHMTCLQQVCQMQQQNGAAPMCPVCQQQLPLQDHRAPSASSSCRQESAAPAAAPDTSHEVAIWAAAVRSAIEWVPRTDDSAHSV